MQHTVYILKRFAKGRCDYSDILQENLIKSYPSLEIKIVDSFNKFVDIAKAVSSKHKTFIFCPEYLKVDEIAIWEQLTDNANLQYIALHEISTSIHLLNSEIKQLPTNDYAYIDGYNYLISNSNALVSTILSKYASWSDIQSRLNELIKQTRKTTCSVFLNYPYSSFMNKNLLALAEECQQINEQCLYVPLVDPIEYCPNLRYSDECVPSNSVWLDYSFSEMQLVNWQNYFLKTQVKNTYFLANIYELSLVDTKQELSLQNWHNFWQSLLNYCEENAIHLICQIANQASSAVISCLKLANEIYVPSYLLQANKGQYGDSKLFNYYQQSLDKTCQIISCDLPNLN